MTPADHYHEYGYVIYRNFFTHDDIAALAHPVNRIYDTWARDHHAEIFDNKLVNMHSLTAPEYFVRMSQERSAFFAALAPLKLTNEIARVCGAGISFHNTQLFFNPTNKQRQPYWHRDLQYSSISDAVQKAELAHMLSLHIRIPLLSEQGLALIPGTHKRWDTDLEHQVRLELHGHYQHEPLPNAVLMSLDPGDMVVFHAQMIHRGNYADNDARKALDICVGKPHPLTVPFFDRRVLPTDDEMDAIANNHWYALARAHSF